MLFLSKKDSRSSQSETEITTLKLIIGPQNSAFSTKFTHVDEEKKSTVTL